MTEEPTLGEEEEEARAQVEEGGLTPEAMRALADTPFQGVRNNICDILKSGFEQIEGAGFADPEMEEDWKTYKLEVETFFQNARPDDPLFRSKLREMTERFARGTN